MHLEPKLLRLVNVWDVASARVVAATPGCHALATASDAIAASHGFPDGEFIPWELHLAAIKRICAAVDLPVSADLERGYGDVAATVADALAAGAVGANLEDALCPIEEMTNRIEAAVAAGRAHGIPLLLNARTDVYLADDATPESERREAALARARAYLRAGADCVFVPGCTNVDTIRLLAGELGPGRLSLLAVAGCPDAHALQELGVARLSHGPYAHRHTLSALTEYARDHFGAQPRR